MCTSNTAIQYMAFALKCRHGIVKTVESHRPPLSSTYTVFLISRQSESIYT